jgi:hypothetical protein
MGNLKRKTVVLTADAANGATGTDSVEDWELEKTWEHAGRAPFLIYRIDIDDEGVDGSGANVTVDDELGNTLAADDPTTYLFQTGDGVDTEYRGVFAFGPLVFTLSDAAEGDVAVVKVIYEAATSSY